MAIEVGVPLENVSSKRKSGWGKGSYDRVIVSRFFVEAIPFRELFENVTHSLDKHRELARVIHHW